MNSCPKKHGLQCESIETCPGRAEGILKLELHAGSCSSSSAPRTGGEQGQPHEWVSSHLARAVERCAAATKRAGLLDGGGQPTGPDDLHHAQQG